MTLKHEDNVSLPKGWADEIRSDAMRLAERDEDFWARQRAQIQARKAESVKPRAAYALIPLLGTSLAMALLAFALMLRAPGSYPVQTHHVQPADDPDQELLMRIEQAVSSGTPQAMEPLTLMVETNSESKLSNKEQHHAN